MRHIAQLLPLCLLAGLFAQWKVPEAVQERKLVVRVEPDYPPAAKRHRITGEVRLAAKIAADGHVADLRVLSGHPLLVKAALKAVNQWKYKPTEINGQRVEVSTTITIRFELSGHRGILPVQVALDRAARPVLG